MKISIILPVHNNENTISKCLESIINQTLKPYEIIVVNNNCKDKTMEILNRYNLDNTKIINCYKNNIGYIRNKAIKKATGDYLIFLDADDYLDDHLIETLSLYNGYDIIRFQPYIVSNNVINYDNKFVYYEEKEFQSGIAALESFSIKHLRYGVFWIYCVKREILPKIKEYKFYEDVATIPDMIRSATKIKNINYYGYYHVVNENGLSNTLPNRIKIKYFKKTCRYLMHKYKDNLIVKEYYEYHLNRKTK